MINITQIKKCIIILGALFLAVSFCTVTHAEMELQTLVNEGFEDGLPSNWNNTGWLDSYYPVTDGAHNGTGWAYSWAKGDTFTLPTLTFENDTEMSFWYAVQEVGTSMTLIIKVDDVEIWNSTFSNTAYQKATINLSAYTGGHIIKIIGFTSGLTGQLLDDVLITTYAESPPDDNGDDTGDDNGGNGGGGGLPPPTNNNPTADASNGEPYVSLVNQPITFDGSASSDDGSIVNWSWDFGDGNSSYGETVTHTYAKAETYTVLLTVRDDQGATDTYLTTALVSNENRPPLTPIITGTTRLQINENATFNISTTDPDDDPIAYVIDWDDGTMINSSYDVNNTLYTISHSWSTAGIYHISCYAKDDEEAKSDTITYSIFVNVTIENIDDEITGYFIDYNNDGKFTSFYNSVTNEEIFVLFDEELGYLIDVDDDGQWDYSYRSEDGLKTYVEPDGSKNETDDDPSTPGFELLLLLAAIGIFIKIKYNKK